METVYEVSALPHIDLYAFSITTGGAVLHAADASFPATPSFGVSTCEKLTISACKR